MVNNKMEEARAGKVLADSLNSKKSEVEIFLSIFHPEIKGEEKRKILKEVR